MPEDEQLNFDFHDSGAEPSSPQGKESDLFDWWQNQGNEGSEEGFDKWKQEQRDRLQKFALRLGLPLGKPVELTLHSGTVLRGTLRLSSAGNRKIPAGAGDRELRNHLRLEIGRADFTAADVASCVRVDSP